VAELALATIAAEAAAVMAAVAALALELASAVSPAGRALWAAVRQCLSPMDT